MFLSSLPEPPPWAGPFVLGYLALELGLVIVLALVTALNWKRKP